MNEKKLNKILEDHKLWLKSEAKEGKRADLTGAYLTGANLTRADLTYTTGNLLQVKSLQVDEWSIVYSNNGYMHIGCEKHKIVNWFNFSNDEINKMDPSALEWWVKWKPILKQIIEISPAEK